ncbi:Ragulator complex protein LAMTOR4 homolog [Sergentomyia squamirostris]
MLNMEKIPDQIGYLVLTEDGSVLVSGGDLENNEAKANIICGLVNLTENIDSKVFQKNSCRRISLVYDDFSYTVCLSNKKIYVVKRRFPVAS